MFFLLTCPVVGQVSDEGQQREAPPNILIITCDNLGYGDLQSYNPDSEILTPNLDRLASEGARLTSFYTASPTCTVSRACLLTGRVPQRHGLVDQLVGVDGNYGVGLNQDEVLIPQLLKQAPIPYACACFGKWNIGFAEGSRPTERGFDEFLGHASGNMDYYRHNYREQHDLYRGIKPLHRNGEYASDLFADASIDFIRRRASQAEPWFVYLAFNAPHFPVKGNKREGEPNIYQAPDWAFAACDLQPTERDPRKRYAATVYALDHAIGRVLAAIDELAIADRTFVFFMSDNGAFRLNREGIDVGVNTPLRGGGVTCWEGGLRVPAFARWPGRIEAGSIIAEAGWSLDILQVCVELANASLPEGVSFDGENLLPILTGTKESPHESFFFQYRHHAALRRGRWKIVREGESEPWQLFDLQHDLSESNDLAATHPLLVKSLAETFGNWLRQFDDQFTGRQSPR